jgi:hypothetical protein
LSEAGGSNDRDPLIEAAGLLRRDKLGIKAHTTPALEIGLDNFRVLPTACDFQATGITQSSSWPVSQRTSCMQSDEGPTLQRLWQERQTADKRIAEIESRLNDSDAPLLKFRQIDAAKLVKKARLTQERFV